MASTVTAARIKDLKSSSYIPKKVKFRAPAEGRIVPTPAAEERVVFIPHLMRGLGFPLHPFVSGLMYFHGLDFHDQAPNSPFHIATFILFCEAFLRIQPHFSLWL